QVGSFANAPLGLPASALISPWGGAIRYIRGDTLVGSSCQSQIVIVMPGPDNTLNNADDLVFSYSGAQVLLVYSKLP
ncbi:hypothetical protein, partial [Parachitinimonas caeni]